MGVVGVGVGVRGVGVGEGDEGVVVYVDRQTPDGHCQLVNLTRADRCRAVRQPGRPTGK